MDQLREYLEDLLEAQELEAEVYISPPPDYIMKYPCLVISRAVGRTNFADNVPYRHMPRYELMAIDEDPDSPLYGFLAKLPTSVHNRSYPADNLNHDVFLISFQEESEDD